MAVAGDEDRLTSLAYTQRYAELFDAAFSSVSEAGHLVPVDQPAAAAALVNSFYTTLEN